MSILVCILLLVLIEVIFLVLEVGAIIFLELLSLVGKVHLGLLGYFLVFFA